MNDIRQYGTPPYNVAVIHGGPGAAGEMAPVADDLALTRGVLEPLFTGRSIAAQVAELNAALEQCEGPATLVGHSWGAWLAVIGAVEYPALVARLVLVGCPPPKEEDASRINETRLLRLSASDRDQAADITAFLGAPDGDKDDLFAQLGRLINRADTYEVVEGPETAVDYSYETFAGVWPEAVAWRRSGRLSEYFNQVTQPVLAIQGDYDPHPAAAVAAALQGLSEARFVLLDHCGHTPWRENQARARFFDVLEAWL